jgi:predicted esterase
MRSRRPDVVRNLVRFGGALGALALAACAGAIARRTAATAHAGASGLSPLEGTTSDGRARISVAAGEGGNGRPVPSRTQEALAWRLARDGTIGAWVVAPAPPRAIDTVPSLGVRTENAGASAAPWKLAVARGGVLDVAAAVDARAGAPGAAYVGGIVHVLRPGRHVLLLGVDDAVSVFVDGVKVFARDATRVRRDDDDLVAFDAKPGDHPVVLSLRRGGGGGRAWTLHARLLDPDLEAPGLWTLPGVSADEGPEAAARVVRVSVDRDMVPDGYRPEVHVRLGEGAPLSTRLHVHVRMARSWHGARPDPLVDADLGVAGDPWPSDDAWTFAFPPLPASAVEDEDWTLHVDVGTHSVDFPFHPRRAVREAVEHAARSLESAGGAAWMQPASRETVEFLRDRLAGFVAKGDGDLDAQTADARELDELSDAIDRGRDPYVGRTERSEGSAGSSDDAPVWRTGPMRRAYRSPADDQPSEFAVYVPRDFDARRTYPLIVALHGMNGYPMQMLMWFFGHDDPRRDGTWEDRHPIRDLDPLQAIVVAPDGHFNAMYRDLGEDDVMRVVDWTMATYPIDPSRVTITGPSMGGIGSAACALHHPAQFAAAAPLCGYHSYFVRSDISPRGLRPWERFIAEERSNVFWAENGKNLPLYIVHGTRDLPEENSGVLIDRYEELHYDVEHDHPDLGHNVWQTTYEDLKGAKWLLPHRLQLHPRALRFKTPRTRWGDDAWLHVRELATSDGWGEVSARVDDRRTITVATHGVRAIGLDRDAVLLDDAAPITVSIDGERTTFQAGEPVELRREPSGDSGGGRARSVWHAAPPPPLGERKAGTITGPLRDIYHEPILFVWGASDPSQARANEDTARAWARVRWGVRVGYPIESDTEFFARGESLANDRALFLVGNGQSNRVVRELEPSFPIRVDGDEIVLGTTRIRPADGAADRSQLGAVFIRPNPRRPDRYVAVVEGVGPLGTWRSQSLPDMLPDYVVYDESVTPARNGLSLGAGSVRAAGFFAQDWSIGP